MLRIRRACIASGSAWAVSGRLSSELHAICSPSVAENMQLHPCLMLVLLRTALNLERVQWCERLFPRGPHWFTGYMNKTLRYCWALCYKNTIINNPIIRTLIDLLRIHILYELNTKSMTNTNTIRLKRWRERCRPLREADLRLTAPRHPPLFL